MNNHTQPTVSSPSINHLQLFIEYSPAAIAMFDRQLRYLAASRRWLEDYGLQNRNIIGQCHYDIFPEIPQRWKEIHQTCLSGVADSCEEDAFPRANGGVDWLKWEVKPWYETSGEVGGLIMLTEIITPRKESELELQETNQQLEATINANTQQLEKTIIQLQKQIEERQQAEEDRDRFFNLVPDMLCLAGFDGYFKQLNPAWTHILGYSPSELFAQPFIELIHPDDQEATLAEAAKLSQGEKTIYFENRYRCKDGSYRWLSWTTTPDPEKQLLYAVARDITAQKLAEQQLQDQTRREKLFNRLTLRIRNSLDFEKIVSTTVEEIQAFLQVDRCHFAWYIENEDGPYWDVTHEVQAMGLSSFVGQYPVEAFGPLSKLLLKRETVRLDNVATVSDPKIRDFILSLGNRSMLVFPVNAHSGRFGIVTCIHHQGVHPWTDEEVDFLEAVVAQLAIALNQSELYQQSRTKSQELEYTLQKLQRTQTQMIQSEKMSSLGQLVAGIAHEINNPVNFIHGNIVHARYYTQDILNLVALYQQHYPEPLPDIEDHIEDIDLDFLQADLPKLLGSMQVGTDRIRQIVLSLRNFSRMDESDMKAVNIHEGIDSTLMILHNRTKAKSDQAGITIIKDYGSLPLVECYAGQLNQVFMNLLSNAIDALEQVCSQNAYFHPQITICTTLTPDQQASIAITDNGPGIPNPIQAKIFNPFFTTKPLGQGTGMGLSISYQIITEKHGGELTCHSSPGEGTTFTILIPLRQKLKLSS